MDHAHAYICFFILINNTMKPIQIISQDLFDKIRSRFSNLEMGDETGAVTIDPAEARFFDFDFVAEGNTLGRISISINDPGSLKIYYSQGITENQDDPTKKYWYSFLKEMRFFSQRRLLRFDTRDIGKDNLDRNDFQVLATTQGKKEEEMPKTVSESRWNHRSTKKTSRAVTGATEVIVRHSRPVDETYPGSRSQRKNIKAIFIQNRDGERFKYPFIHPAGAFAMAQHIDHGGVPHDPGGKAIIRMSEEIAQLQEFQRKVHSATLHDDATGITERAIGRLNELKAKVESLGKRHHYESWMAEFNELEHSDQELHELDPVQFEEYKQKFTQTNFQEELSQYFPLLDRIMKEHNKVDLEEYVREETLPWETDGEAAEREKKEKENPENTKTGSADGHSRANQLAKQAIPKKEAFDIGMGSTGHEKVSPEQKFEEWAEAVEQGKLTPDQLDQFKKALEQLPQGAEGAELDWGPDGNTPWEFFSEFGLTDSELKKKLEASFEGNEDSDPFDTFKSWAKESYPELMTQLGISDEEQPAPDQGQPVPGQEQPVPGQEQPTAENEEMKGREPMMPTREGIVKEVAKIVKSFYNADNESVGPFRGEENIKLDCKKKVAEKFGDRAGEFAEKLAEKFISQLSNKWERKHGAVEDDGFSIDRLQELIGNIKQKIESIGDVGGHPGKNIMPAESNVSESKNPDILDILKLSGLKK